MKGGTPNIKNWNIITRGVEVHNLGLRSVDNRVVQFRHLPNKVRIFRSLRTNFRFEIGKGGGGTAPRTSN